MEYFIELETGRGKLRGMPHPGVILCHGFTGNRMAPQFLFVSFSRLLQRRGIASIRMDFYGSGESEGIFEEMTISSEIEDLQEIPRSFQERAEVDKERVFLLGLSPGGVAHQTDLPAPLKKHNQTRDSSISDSNHNNL